MKNEDFNIIITMENLFKTVSPTFVLLYFKKFCLQGHE